MSEQREGSEEEKIKELLGKVKNAMKNAPPEEQFFELERENDRIVKNILEGKMSEKK